MEVSKEEKITLKKYDPIIYFIIFKGLGKKYRFNLVSLYNFAKTLSGYLDKSPIDQDSYFDFKDRYFRAKEGVYQKDGFIGELYPFMCQTLARENAHSFPWSQWTETFLRVKDLELAPLFFDKEEELSYYLNHYDGLVYSFAFLSQWEEDLYPYLSQLFRLYKHQELILRVEKDSYLSRRYFPLLDSSLLSFSHIEFIRKKESYKNLLQEHLSFESEEIEVLEKEIPFFPKKRRALFYLVLRSLKKRKIKMQKSPEKVFLKPNSFNFSLKKLKILFLFYRFKVLFQKEYPLKKDKN